MFGIIPEVHWFLLYINFLIWIQNKNQIWTQNIYVEESRVIWPGFCFFRVNVFSIIRFKKIDILLLPIFSIFYLILESIVYPQPIFKVAEKKWRGTNSRVFSTITLRWKNFKNTVRLHFLSSICFEFGFLVFSYIIKI